LLAASVDCADAVVQFSDGTSAPGVVVPFLSNVSNASHALPAGKYYVTTPAYAMMTRDGSPVMHTSSVGDFELELGAATADVTDPVVLGAKPAHGGVFTEEIELHFSEPVTVAPGEPGVNLYDCGDDFGCGTDDDGLIARYDSLPNATNGTGGKGPVLLTYDGAKVTVHVTAVAWEIREGRRYKVEVPAGSFVDEQGNGCDAKAFEVLRDGTGFTRASVVPAAVIGDKLDFAVAVPSTAPPGAYAVCYCDAADDVSPFTGAPSEFTYSRVLGVQGSGTTSWSTTPQVGSRSLDEHLCTTKCDGGCVGSDCFCGGGRAADAYCLGHELCGAACGALADCAGFSLTDGTECRLLMDAAATAPAPGSVATFTKSAGEACTDPGDFSLEVGVAVVTHRAHVDVEYVVEPGSAVTIEVTGSNLLDASWTHEPTSTPHRVHIIPEAGRCGVDAPVAMPEVLFVPGTEEVGYVPTPWERDPLARGYREVLGHVCPTENLDIHSASVAIDGVERPLEAYSCRSCIDGACHNPGGMAGANVGYDTATSNALCVDASTCEKLCDTLPECLAYEVHVDKPRCFLNTHHCFPEEPLPDVHYNVYFKRRPSDAEHGELYGLPYVPQYVNSHDGLPSASTEAMLRFKDVVLPTGGSFQLCFCDASLLPPGDTRQCMLTEHFTVPIGPVHSSGIGCLLRHTSTKTCVPMVHGGLRCYGDDHPALS
jgi:hypothetical protein